MNHWLLWKSVPASSPQLFPVHCAGCGACFNLAGLSGHFNHHRVLNKEPQCALGEKYPKKDPGEQLEGVREGWGVEQDLQAVGVTK